MQEKWFLGHRYYEYDTAVFGTISEHLIEVVKIKEEELLRSERGRLFDFHFLSIGIDKGPSRYIVGFCNNLSYKIAFRIRKGYIFFSKKRIQGESQEKDTTTILGAWFPMAEDYGIH